MAEIYLSYRKNKKLYTACFTELAQSGNTVHSYLLLGEVIKVDVGGGVHQLACSFGLSHTTSNDSHIDIHMYSQTTIHHIMTYHTP